MFRKLKGIYTYIVMFICFAFLIGAGSCVTTDKTKSFDKSDSKIRNEHRLKTIPEVIGPPKERTKAIEQNKIIWGPQDRFLDKKATQEKIEIKKIEPEQ